MRQTCGPPGEYTTHPRVVKGKLHNQSSKGKARLKREGTKRAQHYQPSGNANQNHSEIDGTSYPLRGVQSKDR